MIKVIIADDHPVVRIGIKCIINECTDIIVVGEVDQGDKLITKVMNDECDVVLVEILFPDRSGLDVLHDIKKLKPELGVLVYSRYPENKYALRAFKRGASGYLTKSCRSVELITAIRKVARGGKYITPVMAECIAFDLDESIEQPLHKTLSDREFEVMCLIAEGKSTVAIAEKLLLSPKTISTYRKRIMEKMNLMGNSDIIRYAIKKGCVEL